MPISKAAIPALIALMFVGGCVANAGSDTGARDNQWQQLALNPDCPQADNFLDASAGSAGAGYAKPFLRVGCTDDHVVVQSNGIPSFTFVPMTPNPLRTRNYTWRIPRHPKEAATKRQIPLLGPAAIAVDGLPIFGPNEAPTHGTADPFLDQLLDACGGHTAGGGMYHFHVLPKCLFDKIDGRVSLVVGYAFDGYPILGPYECTDASCRQTVKVRSSWKKSGNGRHVWNNNAYAAGLGDLDRCNGMTRPDGSYAYYATETFPYLLACYHGEANLRHDGMRGGGERRRGPGRPGGPGGPGGFGPPPRR